MIDCYIICDMDNEVSKWYLERSLESFERVSDLLTIHPVQCTTPATLPIRFEKNQEPIPFYVADDGVDYLRARHYGGTFCDNPVYNSIMYSQMKLIQRIADGEQLIIMEHDAALVDENSLRYQIDEYFDEVDIFMPGACMEFYSVSQRYAQEFVEYMDNFPYRDNRVSGPFGAMQSMERDNPKDASRQVLMPTKQRNDVDLICLSSSISSAIYGEGFDLHLPATKQFMKCELGSTNAQTHEMVFDDNEIDPVSGVRKRDFVFID